MKKPVTVVRMRMTAVRRKANDSSEKESEGGKEEESEGAIKEIVSVSTESHELKVIK